jgi:hypothetical protein
MQIALAGCCAAPAAVEDPELFFPIAAAGPAEFAMVSVAVARDRRRDHRRVAGADRVPGRRGLSDAETTPGNRMGRRAVGNKSRLFLRPRDLQPVHQRDDGQAVMALPGTGHPGQRPARRVSQQVNLAAQPPRDRPNVSRSL